MQLTPQCSADQRSSGGQSGRGLCWLVLEEGVSPLCARQGGSAKQAALLPGLGLVLVLLVGYATFP